MKMRGLLPVLLMCALPSTAMLAQRGGGGHGGGGFASHGGGFSAPHMSGGFSSRPAPSSFSSVRSFNAPPYRSDARPYIASQGRAPYGAYRQPYRNGQYGYRLDYRNSRYRPIYRSNYYAGSYIVPGYLGSGWDYGYDDGSDGYGVSNEQASAAPAQNYGADESMSSESYANNPYATPYTGEGVPPPPPAEAGEPAPQAVVQLVFKDGHSQLVRNYAVTSKTLYLLDDAATGRSPEIPISTIDLAATEKANRSLGVTFSVPASN